MKIYKTWSYFSFEDCDFKKVIGYEFTFTLIPTITFEKSKEMYDNYVITIIRITWLLWQMPLISYSKEL